MRSSRGAFLSGSSWDQLRVAVQLAGSKGVKMSLPDFLRFPTLKLWQWQVVETGLTFKLVATMGNSQLRDLGVPH